MGSGFHLWWHGVPSDEPVISCSVVLEVLVPPAVPTLYFWALQASFLDGSGRSYGAAHTGLQWNPRHPGGRAVNWGGYAQAADVGSVLDGSDSPLDGIPGDRNTRNFAWLASVPYRFTIHPGVAGRVELPDGDPGPCRQIGHRGRPAGDRLGGFVMWSELFCRGRDPSSAVRWSQPQALTASGRTIVPRSLHATFPDGREWRDLDVLVDGVGVQQVTTTGRTLRGGVVPLRLDAP